MPLTTTALNAMMSTIASNAPYLAAHTADPGAAGLNPASSARLAAAWSVASNGGITSGTKTFTGGTPNGPVTHIGFWSALTGGTYYGSFPVAGDSTFNSTGAYTMTSINLSVATS